MSQFVKPENVFVRQSLSSRREVLRFLSDRARDLGVTNDPDAVFQAFLAREEMGETGMTDGFAVPHAKSEAVLRPAVLVLKNDRRIEWPSFDEKPVDTFISLLVPEGEEGTAHIKLLSRTAVLLMREKFKAFVRSTDDPAAIAQALDQELTEALAE